MVKFEETNLGMKKWGMEYKLINYRTVQKQVNLNGSDMWSE